MKIDFNSDKSMTIKLDKVPRLLYINEEGHSCGQIYIDGVRKCPLKSVHIKAQTDDKWIRPINYVAQYCEQGKPGLLLAGSGNIEELLQTNVRILDLKEVRELIILIKDMICDKRIPAEISEQYRELLKNIVKKIG